MAGTLKATIGMEKDSYSSNLALWSRCFLAKKLPQLPGLSVDPRFNRRCGPVAGDLTSVALLNTHESMRGDAEADLVSRPRMLRVLTDELGKDADDEFLGLLSKL